MKQITHIKIFIPTAIDSDKIIAMSKYIKGLKSNAFSSG